MTIRRDDGGWSSEERQALLLAALYAAPSRIHTTEQLRTRLAPYRGTGPGNDVASRRRLNRDIESLVARGLVARYDPTSTSPTHGDEPEPDWQDAQHPDDAEPAGRSSSAPSPAHSGPERRNARQESGIKLLLPDKPQRLFLTSHEHRALARARGALGRGPATVSPFTESGDAPDRLDYAGMLLRHLEESAGPLPVDQIGSALGLAPRQVEEVLAIVQDLDAAVDHHCMLSIDIDDPDPVLLVTHGRQDSSLRHPGRAPGGLNAFSRAAYTRAETRDRLDLIEQALSSGHLDDSDALLLRTAREKLTAWSDILDASFDSG